MISDATTVKMPTQIQVVSQKTKSMPSRSSDACSGSQSTKTAMHATTAPTIAPITTIVTMAPLRTAHERNQNPGSEPLLADASTRVLWSGQLDEERRAAARRRIDPDAPVHAPDELAADVETEAGPADAPGEARVEPVELLEDALVVARG